MSNTNVKNGFMDYFLLFEVYNHLNEKKRRDKYKKNLDRLIESKLLISADTPEKEVKLNNNFNNEIDRRKETYKSCIEKEVNIPSYLASDIKKIAEKPSIYFHQTKEYFGIELKDNIEDLLYVSQLNAIQQLIAMYELEEKHTGIPTKEFKNKFLLWPVKVILNGTNLYINVYLTTFKNGCTMLQFSLEVNEQNLDELNINTWNIEFEKVMFPEFIIIEDGSSQKYKKKARCTNLKDISKVYCEHLMEIFGSGANPITIEFNHLTLIDYDYIPKSFENKDISDPFKDMIYKLLFAPISEFTQKGKDHISITLEAHYHDFSLHYRTYANYTRLVSAFSDRVKKPFKTINEEPISDRGLYFSGIGAVITSIEILMLKKYSHENNSLAKINHNMSLKELIEQKIRENVDFFHEFSQFYFDYASVRDFTNFLERSCHDYLQTELLLNHRRRVEELIELKKEKNVARFTALSPILTILVTLIFSLPTIKQILKILELQNHLLSTYLVINCAFIFFICYLYRESIMKRTTNYKDLISNKLIRFFKFIKGKYNLLWVRISGFFKE